MIFTTSWDDGHPLDVRVAELLAAHGMRGTFYVPLRNSEGRSVLSKLELRELAQGFEIGGHTYDHVRLGALPAARVAEQLASAKRALEDRIGREVIGFCYPGGRHDARIRASVVEAGYRYARTVENLRFEPGDDPLQLPTTLQLYPHTATTYVTNFVRGGHWSRRTALAIALEHRDLAGTLRALFDRARAVGEMFHLWGHSWELEQCGLWGELEAFLGYVAEHHPRCATNAELIASASAVSNRSAV